MMMPGQAKTLDFDLLEAVEHSGLPVYVVVGEHRRSIAECGTHGFAISHDDGAQQVDVGVLRNGIRDPSGGAVARTLIADTLASRLLLARHQDVPAGTDAAEWFTSIEHKARALTAWEPIEIDVDGRPARFMRLWEDDHWVGFTDLGEASLYIHSFGTPSDAIALAEESDLRSSLG
jgi:hypothetical protein